MVEAINIRDIKHGKERKGIMSFKVVVAGSRTFCTREHYAMLHNKLQFLLSRKADVTIISGDARGADSLGVKYAKEKGHDIMHFPADWNKYGKSAGYKRNVEMADNADAVVVFWNGISKGSEHMINIAKERKLPLVVYKF